MPAPVDPAPPGAPVAFPGAAARHHFGGRSRPARLIAVSLAVIFITVTLIKTFLLGVFVVPTVSMEPLLSSGDRILVNLTGRPARGDVIVFDGTGSFTVPASSLSTVLGSGPLQLALGVDQRTFFVKRVIGIPGDTVACCAPDGRLIVNGVAQVESYVFVGDAPARTPFTVTVPSGFYWVMGDHRDQSADSRTHLAGPTHGLVPESAVQGTLAGTLFSAGTARDGSGSGPVGR
ncbi:signal peptidase I [Tessaracoccus sp.]